MEINESKFRIFTQKCDEQFRYLSFHNKQMKIGKIKNAEVNYWNYICACCTRFNNELIYLKEYKFKKINDGNAQANEIINFLCHIFICESIAHTWNDKVLGKNNNEYFNFINDKSIFCSKLQCYEKEISYIKNNVDLLYFVRAMVFAHPLNYDRNIKTIEDLKLCNDIYYPFSRLANPTKDGYDKKCNFLIRFVDNKTQSFYAQKSIWLSTNDFYVFCNHLIDFITDESNEKILEKINDNYKNQMSEIQLEIKENDKLLTISNFLDIIEKKNIFDNDDNNIINELYMLKFIFKNFKKFRIDFLDYLWNIFLKIVNLAKTDILEIDFNDDFDISHKILGVSNFIDKFDRSNYYCAEKYHYLYDQAIFEIKNNKYCKNLNEINFTMAECLDDFWGKIKNYDYSKTLMRKYSKVFINSFNSKSYAEFHAYLLQDIYLIKCKKIKIAKLNN